MFVEKHVNAFDIRYNCDEYHIFDVIVTNPVGNVPLTSHPGTLKNRWGFLFVSNLTVQSQ